MPDVSAKQIWARDILLTNDWTAKTAYLNTLKFSYSFTKRSIVDESKFIRLLWTCSRFGLSPFWPYPFRGHFEGERLVGLTPFALLKCLKTHYERHYEPFFYQNALDCRILQIQSQNFSGCNTLGPRRSDPGAWIQRHQFPLSSPAFPFFLFYERTSGAIGLQLWTAFHYLQLFKANTNPNPISILYALTFAQWAALICNGHCAFSALFYLINAAICGVQFCGGVSEVSIISHVAILCCNLM